MGFARLNRILQLLWNQWAGMMPDSAVCKNCGQHFEYTLIHNGFNDSAYDYCDTCGGTALITAWSEPPTGVNVKFHQRLNEDVERHLKQCKCGGHFALSASPRCPHCKNLLSPIEAKTWIEANAPGTVKRWRWQSDWKGLYCIVVDGNISKDPWNDDSVP